MLQLIKLMALFNSKRCSYKLIITVKRQSTVANQIECSISLLVYTWYGLTLLFLMFQIYRATLVLCKMLRCFFLEYFLEFITKLRNYFYGFLWHPWDTMYLWWEFCRNFRLVPAELSTSNSSQYHTKRRRRNPHGI